jgi:monoamine oxidase
MSNGCHGCYRENISSFRGIPRAKKPNGKTGGTVTIMKKRVAVIGGGVAGLSAASTLVRMGCKVILLEAKNHLGGRIHTKQVGHLPIELGAEFLYGESQTITNAIQAAGLSTHTIAEDCRLFEAGHLKHANFPDKVGKIIHDVNVHQTDCSFEEFLEIQNLNIADREEAVGFVEGFHAAQGRCISAHSLRRGQYAARQMPGTKPGRINEGYGALVNFLEREIRAHGGKFLTNAPVEKVSWQPGHMEIMFHHGDREILIQADAAVITLPLGVLKAGTVEFQPPLTAKREAIEQLQFGNVVKVVFEFGERWWPDFGFIFALDEVFPIWWADPRGSILTGWAGGPKADMLLEYSPAQLKQFGLKTLALLFPEHAGTIPAQFVSAHTFNWAQDPCTRGAFSHLPVNGLDLPKLLGAPIADTLFFAGEATVTDAQTGTVFGAFETGLRAGRELLATIADTSPLAILPLQK